MERKQEAIDIVASYVLGDRPTAEAIIERLQDDGLLHLGYGDVAVDKIVGTFKEQFGTSVITKPDRASAHRLANTHTEQAVVTVIEMLASLRDEKYAPTVGSVRKLDEKWVNVIGFLRRQGQQSEVIEV